MRFNLMAYPSVKMKGETMSDQRPIASSETLWDKHIYLATPHRWRGMPILFARGGRLHEKVG